MKKLLETNRDATLLFTRVALGLVMLTHGAQKLLGAFGGYGFQGTMNFFTTQMHIPAPFAFLAIVAEFFGSIALILGLFSRVSAFGIAGVIAVAAATVMAPNGFFMNWFGNQKGEGVEYAILMVALAVPIIIKGGGLYSVDGWLISLKKRSTTPLSAEYVA